MLLGNGISGPKGQSKHYISYYELMLIQLLVYNYKDTSVHGRV